MGAEPDAVRSAAESVIGEVPLVYVVKHDYYLARGRDGAFDLAVPIKNRRAAHDVLIALKKCDPRSIQPKNPLDDSPEAPGLCAAVHGFDCVPNVGPFVRMGDALYLNTWTPPTLKPAPGEWSRLRRILLALVNEDPAALEYVLDWSARKIQSPGEMNRTALLFQSAPGLGKNVFFRVLSEVLGERNTAIIGDDDLAKPYNTHYAGRLLLLANELLSQQGRTFSLNDRLKPLITDSRATLEAKGVGRVECKSRVSLIAATNNDGALKLDREDRRWSVFQNMAPVSEAHRRLLRELHDPARTDTFTESFKVEIAAFAHAMGSRRIDSERLSRPFENEARCELRELSESPAQEFARQYAEAGGAAERWKWLGEYLQRTRFPASNDTIQKGAVRLAALYAVFRVFCEEIGTHPQTERNFCLDLKRLGWVNLKAHGFRGWVPPQPFAEGVRLARSGQPAAPRVAACE